MKPIQNNATLDDMEKQLEQKLAKMYRSMPNSEVEGKVERDLARRLGGELAQAFFK